MEGQIEGHCEKENSMGTNEALYKCMVCSGICK